MQALARNASALEFADLTDADSAERRFAPRRASHVPAEVYFEGGVGFLPCLIRDMSTTGARLRVLEGWDNPFYGRPSLRPDRIQLVIRQDRVMYDCRIVRRGEKELGVKFLAAPRPIARVVR